MSTSIHGGLVELAGSLYGAATHPADTAQLRDGLANGLLHIADEFGQVRVNYCPIAPTFATNDLDAFETVDATPIADRWYQVGAPFGVWPLTCASEGTPYRLRVRLAVASTALDAAETHDYRVVLAPDGRGREEMLLSEDHVFAVTTSPQGTTGSWASGTSQGDLGHATLLTLDAPRARGWVSRVSVYDAVSSGSPRSIDQLLVAAYVFARTSDPTNLPRVHRLFLAEYVGT